VHAVAGHHQAGDPWGALQLVTHRAWFGTVSGIEPIHPTLEDVFVSLTAGRKEQA
jgi:hypothetical protein